MCEHKILVRLHEVHVPYRHEATKTNHPLNKNMSLNLADEILFHQARADPLLSHLRHVNPSFLIRPGFVSSCSCEKCDHYHICIDPSCPTCVIARFYNVITSPLENDDVGHWIDVFQHCDLNPFGKFSYWINGWLEL